MTRDTTWYLHYLLKALYLYLDELSHPSNQPNNPSSKSSAEPYDGIDNAICTNVEDVSVSAQHLIAFSSTPNSNSPTQLLLCDAVQYKLANQLP